MALETCNHDMNGDVCLPREDFDELYGLFENLMSLNVSEEDVVESVKAENAIWKKLKAIKADLDD